MIYMQPFSPSLIPFAMADLGLCVQAKCGVFTLCNMHRPTTRPEQTEQLLISSGGHKKSC